MKGFGFFDNYGGLRTSYSGYYFLFLGNSYKFLAFYYKSYGGHGDSLTIKLT